MNVELSRRMLLRAAGASAAGTALGALGFGGIEAAHAASIRAFRLVGTTEARNTCPYCSVACGIITYARGDISKGETAQLIHIEGDVDHPTNRGTLCPKGAGLLDFVRAETRLTQPKIRRPGSNRFEPISWNEALDRIARLMKEDRDANFIAKNEAGQTVNRWLTTGVLAASASSNEAGYMTHKVIRSLGMLVFDNQARV